MFHSIFLCFVLFCLFSVSACSESPKEQYLGYSAGGYLKKTSTNSYDVFTVSSEGKVRLVSGQYVVESEIPGFLKRRIPLSVQRIFTVKTEKCGDIIFAEPYVGKIICKSCVPHSFRSHNNCPLNGAWLPFEWTEL